ncbi:type I secretion C-terminal target domain [Hoeflea sp. IMCC20628]|uniref:tandem-95 repeat protein n=1 Tax=Hoeflea sp. IMCC20628 TaxID=1620421 RepID=UPI00063BEA62|nr:tandem-95 repeat protein [Hoeflea sp. IMCC20628]AKH99519.1 type I secretion C-terminal target domain [Hoeflea sp. IMCC20628]
MDSDIVVHGKGVGNYLATVPASALTLEEAVDEALRSNPEILSSAENREAVEFELRQARGLYLPTLDLEASAGGRKLDSPGRRRLGTDDDSLNPSDVGLTFTQTLFDGGARRAEVERQAARVDGASFRVAERSEAIALAVSQEYFEILLQAEIVAIARKNANVLSGIVSDISSGVSGGALTSADRTQGRERLLSAKARLKEAEEDLAQAQIRFLRLVGIKLGSMKFPPSVAKSLPRSVTEAVDIARRQSPRIAAVDNAVFSGNATTDSGGSGEGAISFYLYNGDVTLTGVTVQTPGAAAENGIQFRGVDAPFQPMGNVTLDGVSVAGTYSKVGVAIYNFANANGLDITGLGLTVNVSAKWHGFNIDGIDGNLDLSGVPLSVTNSFGTGSDDIAIQGLGGNNTFIGDDSNDLLIGGAGIDILRGGDGDDYMIDGGKTTFDGGAGVDTVDFSAVVGKVTVDLNDGGNGGGYAVDDATFIGVENLILNAADTSAGAASQVIGNSSDNVIVGSGRDDIILGREGNDTIYGNDGDDIIDGGAGIDILHGGDGNDTLRLSVGGASTLIHTVDLRTNTVSGGELAGDTISGFENVTAAHNSTANFIGDDNANILTGSNNGDVLRGMGDDDTLIGDKGYNGGTGDILVGGEGNDTLKGGGGSDKLYGNEDTNIATDAVNRLAQAGESDTAVFDGVAADYNVSREADGSWRVEDIAAGKTDELYGIEGIDFGGDGVDLDLLGNVFVFDASGNLVGTFEKIQDGIDVAGTGYTVEVHAGVYTEQVQISTDNLTLVGIGNVVIEAPSAGLVQTSTDPQSGKALYSVLTVEGAENVSIELISIDGNWQAGQIAGGADFNGIVFADASGSIDNVQVLEIGDTPINEATGQVSGNQRGNAILVTNGAGLPNAISVTNTTVTEFQKTGMIFRNADVTTNGNTITTVSQAVMAQNGIQMSSGSTGTLSGNTISGLGYTGAGAWSVVAILVFDASGLIINGNSYTGTSDNDVGVYLINSSGGTVSANAFTDADYGVIDYGTIPVVNDVVNTGATANTYTGIELVNHYLGLDPASQTTVLNPVGSEGVDAYYGGAGADTLDGRGGNDELDGGAGADILIGGGGDDNLEGGDGADTAQYTTVLTATDITTNVSGGWTVTTGGLEGTDTLSGIEVVDGLEAGGFLLVGNGGYATIQAAVNAANAGDTILIAEGTWSGAGNVGVIIDKPLSVLGFGNGSTVADTIINGGGFIVDMAADYAGGTVLIQNLAITNAVGSGISSQDAEILGTLAIDNVRVEGGTGHGVYATGRQASTAYDKAGVQNVSITNSSFVDNAQSSSNSANIMLFEFDGNATITNVLASNSVTGGSSAAYGVQINGVDGPFYNQLTPVPGSTIGSYDVLTAMGTVTIDGLDVEGATRKASFYIQGYTDMTGLTVTNSTVDTVSGWGKPVIIDPMADQLPSGTPNDSGNAGSFFDDSAANGSYELSGLIVVQKAGQFSELDGTTKADTITGTGANDQITGFAGTDTINAGAGDDAIIWSVGDGNDAIDGGTEGVLPDSADTLIINNVGGAETEFTVSVAGTDIIAPPTDDILVFDGSDTVRIDEIEDIVFNLGSNDDSVTVAGNFDATALHPNTITVNGGSGNNEVDASGISSGHRVVFNGNGGNDTFTSGAGNDSFDGGADNDTFVYGGNFADVTVSGSGASLTVSGAHGVDTVTGVEQLQFDDTTVLFVDSAATYDGAYGSIGAALTAAAAIVGHVTIQIAAGTYDENLFIDRADLTLKGAGDATVIHGTFKFDNGIAESGSVGTFLETTGSYQTMSGSGIKVSADNVTIEDLKIDSFHYGIKFEDLASGVNHTTLNNVTIEDTVEGIHKGTSADISYLTINDGSITDGYVGINFAKTTGSISDGLAEHVTIDGTDFSNLTRKGIYAETLSHALIDHVTMNDVGQFGSSSAGTGGNGININLKAGVYTDITISNFHLTNVGASDQNGGVAVGDKNGGAIVIEARDDGSYTGSKAATLTDVLIIDGIIDGRTSTGIQVGEPDRTNAGPAVTVTNVAISGTDTASGEHGDITNETLSTVTVNMTEGAENLLISPDSTGNFIINGMGGADTITGGGGDDVIDAGAGDDVIHWNVGGGHDLVDGGVVTDTDTFEVFGDGALGEEFLIETVLAYNTRTSPIGTFDDGTEIVVSRATDASSGAFTIVAQLQNIDDIVINGTAATPTSSGTNVTVSGNFSGTDLDTSTITINGSQGDDTIDVSQFAASGHKVVFVTNGGHDTVTGARAADQIDVQSRTPQTLEDLGGSTGYKLTFTDGSSVNFTGDPVFVTGSGSATPTVINLPPVANDDAISGNEDQAGGISGNVLDDNGNGADVDLDGGTPAVVANAAITTAQGGTVNLSGNGDFTYTPLADFNGTDTFDYTLVDGQGGSSAGTVTLTVAPVNDAPVAVDDTFAPWTETLITFDPGSSQRIPDGYGGLNWSSDTSPNGSTPDFYFGQSGGRTIGYSGNAGANSTFESPDGSEFDLNSLNLRKFGLEQSLQYQTNYAATEVEVSGYRDGFEVYSSVAVSLNFAGTDVALNFENIDAFKISVTGFGAISGWGFFELDDISYSRGLSISEDTAHTFAAADLVGNDTDVDDDALSISAVSATSAKGAEITLNTDGTISYDPTAAATLQALDDGETLEDSFTYTVSDGQGGEDTATVTLTVNGVDEAAIVGEPLFPLEFDGEEAIGTNRNALSSAELAPIIAAALLRWEAAGLSDDQLVLLSQTNVSIDDLGGTMLGQTANDGIVIDINAAGQGWYIDQTPEDDVEFEAGVAPDGVDLLTVVMHEFGHVLDLGHSDGEADGLMASALAAGERRLPDMSDLSGHAAAQVITGDAGDNLLIGGDGDDFLFGLDGDDILNGGFGSDTLTGGAGADTFVFDAAALADAMGGGIQDLIADYNFVDGDVVDLSELLGSEPVDAGNAGDYVRVNGTFLEVDVDGTGSGAGFVQVAEFSVAPGTDALRILVDDDSTPAVII